MLINFLLALGAISFLIVHDLMVEKKTFSFKGHYIKYVAALLIGTFGLPYFLDWQYGQYALSVGGIVLFGLSFNAIAQLANKKGLNVPSDGGLKMGAIINAEDPNHPNSNGSRVFALIAVAFYAVITLISFLYHGLPSIWEVITAGVLVIASAVINFENRFETNDNWKTAVLVVALLFTVIIYGIRFSQTAN